MMLLAVVVVIVITMAVMMMVMMAGIVPMPMIVMQTNRQSIDGGQAKLIISTLQQ
jgi:hypothetical protein